MRRGLHAVRVLPTSWRVRLGIGALVALFAGGAAWAAATGAISTTSIHDWLTSLGPLAPALFVVAFIAGSLVGLPGMAFVLGARLAFGPQLGFVLGYGAGVCACLVPFLLARRLPPTLWRPSNRHLRRAFDLVDTHPFRAVLVLRLVLWFNAPMSYALALSTISPRTYFAACAAALAPVVAIACIAVGWFL